MSLRSRCSSLLLARARMCLTPPPAPWSASIEGLVPEADRGLESALVVPLRVDDLQPRDAHSSPAHGHLGEGRSLCEGAARCNNVVSEKRHVVRLASGSDGGQVKGIPRGSPNLVAEAFLGDFPQGRIYALAPRDAADSFLLGGSNFSSHVNSTSHEIG